MPTGPDVGETLIARCSLDGAWDGDDVGVGGITGTGVVMIVVGVADGVLVWGVGAELVVVVRGAVVVGVLFTVDGGAVGALVVGVALLVGEGLAVVVGGAGVVVVVGGAVSLSATAIAGPLNRTTADRTKTQSARKEQRMTAPAVHVLPERPLHAASTSHISRRLMARYNHLD